MKTGEVHYEQSAPTVAVAEEVRMAEEEKPMPQFDARRQAVINDLIKLYPQYVFTPSDAGERLGGSLGCDNCDLPEITFWPSHAMTGAGFGTDPQWSQQMLVAIGRTFERHHFAIYDPENEKIWASGELAAWLPSAVRDEQLAVKAIQERSQPQKPWWKLW